jgi:hypothetical protein
MDLDERRFDEFVKTIEFRERRLQIEKNILASRTQSSLLNNSQNLKV